MIFVCQEGIEKDEKNSRLAFPEEYSLTGPGHGQGNANQEETAFYPKRHLFTLLQQMGGAPAPTSVLLRIQRKEQQGSCGCRCSCGQLLDR